MAVLETMNILGISCYYHDSAACLLRDGEVVAAAQEERFTRKKHDECFPQRAVAYCLEEGGITIDDVDHVVFYEKPFLKFERLLETYLAFAPRGIRSYLIAMPVWIKEKFWLAQVIKKELKYRGKILFTEHHQSHAASAFFASPFDHAAVLTMDGVGEWATASYGVGTGNKLTLTHEISFPHSLGLLYSAFTYYTGFKVNSGEYKLMGLAPYGEPTYVDLIYRHLIDLKEDGSFRLNMKYFNYAQGFTMTNGRFHRLFGGPPRQPETDPTQKDMDLARSIQEVTEEIIMRIARHVYRETGQKNLCLAGGVALNCVANGRLLREGPFEHIWIQPAAGDAGGALGAALWVWHEYLGNPRVDHGIFGIQQGSYFGPQFDNEAIEACLRDNKAPFERIADDAALCDRVADILAREHIVGWFQGRMEFGPRALGNRSILGDPRSRNMQSILNLKIKFRESFRPFAPSVLAEDTAGYFELDAPSLYMLLTANVRRDKRVLLTAHQERLWGIEKLKAKRSVIPAVTHVDYSARVQTVHREINPRYHALIAAFKKKTGCSVIVNTSFNVRGEPIVCTPEDAYRCFMRTDMDYLVMGNYLLDKKSQPAREADESWKETYTLD